MSWSYAASFPPIWGGRLSLPEPWPLQTPRCLGESRDAWLPGHIDEWNHGPIKDAQGKVHDLKGEFGLKEPF